MHEIANGHENDEGDRVTASSPASRGTRKLSTGSVAVRRPRPSHREREHTRRERERSEDRDRERRDRSLEDSDREDDRLRHSQPLDRER